MLTVFTLDEQDNSRFDHIYKKYKNTVYAIIHRKIGDTGFSEDIMQEVFLRFYKTMWKLQTEDDMRRWLFCITKNAAIDGAKKDSYAAKKIVVSLDNEEIVADFLDKTAGNPLDAVLKLDIAKQIAEVLDTLKPIHAQVIRLRYYFEYTVNEIAKMERVPEHTVYSRLDKARNLLHSRLSFLQEKNNVLLGGVCDE